MQFLKDAAERAAKSSAQALLLLWIGGGAFNVFDVPDWRATAGIAAGAAVLSVLTSVISLPVGPRGSASMVIEARQPTPAAEL